MYLQNNNNDNNNNQNNVVGYIRRNFNERLRCAFVTQVVKNGFGL